MNLYLPEEIYKNQKYYFKEEKLIIDDIFFINYEWNYALAKIDVIAKNKERYKMENNQGYKYCVGRGFIDFSLNNGILYEKSDDKYIKVNTKKKKGHWGECPYPKKEMPTSFCIPCNNKSECLNKTKLIWFCEICDKNCVNKK